MSTVLTEETQAMMNNKLRQHVLTAGFVWEHLSGSLTAEKRDSGNVVVLRLERAEENGHPLKVVITSSVFSEEVEAVDTAFKDIVESLLKTAVTCLQVSDRLKVLNVQ